MLTASILLSACGGGGDDDAETAPPPDDPRTVAAQATAANNPLCQAVAPFYWEIGNRSTPLASGRVGDQAPQANTELSIASASKWLYASYVTQKHNGVREQDVPFLNFTSGYDQFGQPLCERHDTVGSCLQGRDGRTDANIGKFSYSSGHMQVHGVNEMGLGEADNAALATEVNATLQISGFRYTQPQPAGGMAASATGYAAFLRRMLSGDLLMLAQLGTHAVCANEAPAVCGAEVAAVGSPMPPGSQEAWHYSLGHWVEDDPEVGDGAFSSPGAFGFYPWIDAEKTLYGILARQTSPLDGEESDGFRSAECGRLIRKAWKTGREVTAATP